MTLDLTFAICTHRRNALLQRALASLIAAERPPDLAIEVVVVDNSDHQEAAAVIAAAAERARRDANPFLIRGVAAHPANISVARNAALQASGAPWLAFLDDDQHVARDWFIEVRRAINETSADALFGAIAPQFEKGAAPTAAAQNLFTRNLGDFEGGALYAYGPHKMRGGALTPGNALFRRSTMFAQARFDPAFGLAGGEDFDLFCRLQRDGRRFVWRPSLRAFEFVPASRCEPAYLRRRFYAGGQVYAAAIAGLSPSPRRARWRLRAKALAQALWLAPGAAAATLRGGVARDETSYVLAGVLGKLSMGSLHPLYREQPNAKIGQSLLTKI
jgi:succinoglycan biosynthesis protein ExoM